MINAVAKFAWSSPNTESDPTNPIVSIDLEGNVLSRFLDQEWIFPISRINPLARSTVKWPDLSDNVSAAKDLAFLRLSHGPLVGWTALVNMTRTLSALASFCEEHRVNIKRLHRHPTVAIDFCKVRASNERISKILSVARISHINRDTLGWTFLYPDQIKALDAIHQIEAHQNPVVPNRIYFSIEEIVDKILEDYLSISDDLDSLCAIWATAGRPQRRPGHSAHWPVLMEKYPNVNAVLNRWCSKGKKKISPFITIVRVAAYWRLCAGSSARASEIKAVQRRCLTIEQIGDHRTFLLTSRTTKTQQNANAIWVVSPQSEIAVLALERLLEWYKTIHPSSPNPSDFLFQNFDHTFGVEPQRLRKGKKHVGYPLHNITFKDLLKKVDLKITQSDFEEAKRLTPSLDERKYAVGKTWVVTPQQLRRTVLVRAAASGLVSMDSLSFQAKHRSWQMTAYYCQNYWHLSETDPNNPLAAGTARQDAIEFTTIFADSYNLDRQQIIDDDRFFSPYGMDHKRNTVSSIPMLSLTELQSGIKANVLKKNTLGVCAQTDFCTWQSAETVRGCLTKMGGKPCAKAIVDSSRITALKTLLDDLNIRLDGLRMNDHFSRENLQADISATKIAIDLIESNIGDIHASK